MVPTPLLVRCCHEKLLTSDAHDTLTALVNLCAERLKACQRRSARLGELQPAGEPESDHCRSCARNQVFVASSVAKALLRLGERRPDLVMVDVMMPGMTGLQLCDFLRHTPDTRGVPLLVCSSHHLPRHSNTGLYDAAVTKPVDLLELMQVIRTLLPAAAKSSALS